MKNKILIGELENLKNSEWWKYVVSELQREIDRLTDELLWINPENNKVILTANDLMKAERLSSIDLINKPQELIDSLSPVEQINWQEV